MRLTPNVLTIPVGTAFLPVFVDAFRSGRLFGTAPLVPAVIAASRIFVPTQRSASALLSVFAAAGGGLLPRVLPLGDSDALDEVLPQVLAGPEQPVIGSLDRQLALFKLIERWRSLMLEVRKSRGQEAPFLVAASRADAFGLAGDLARLIDEATIEDVALSRLAEGVPADYRAERHSEYWAMTETFLRIAATAYPGILGDADMMDAAEQLKRRTRAFAEALRLAPSQAPIVVAGSTGSVTATAELMGVVSRLPMGAVVLPGFDRDVLDDVAWDMIGSEEADLPTRFGHPQGVLKRTIERIGITRDDVQRLAPEQEVSPRERLLAEIFRPAETTGHWAEGGMKAEALSQAVSGMTLINAADEREEAVAIALLFRETIQSPDKTAALVTPDRSLARAVQAELQRWDIDVVDSAGEPLALTAPAMLARLSLAAAAPEALGIDILDLLRLPLALAGLSSVQSASVATTIEMAALRGKRLMEGMSGLPETLRQAVDEDTRYAPSLRQRLSEADLSLALKHAERLRDAFSAFHARVADEATLRAYALAHRDLLTDLGMSEDGEALAWSGVAGEALAAVFETVVTAREDGPELTLDDYAEIFETLLASEVIRPRQPGHPRLKIWGLLEARLLEADRVILAGLDEGIWPPEARSDAFLNRPMRIALGMPPPERRIGQTAHDFMTLCGAPEVILTRAIKRGSSPTIASRFLRRLLAFAGEKAETEMKGRGLHVLGWARVLDKSESFVAIEPPKPVVPADLTPRQLRVTEIETLYRDPYSIYASRILGLDPLDPLDPPLDARDRGTIVHEALAKFAQEYPGKLPDDAEAQLLRIARSEFAGVEQADPEAVQFWWRRFERFVPWYLEWEKGRREVLSTLTTEEKGLLPIHLEGGHILKLSTRADRIEYLKGGGISIVDYKTGQPPGNDEVVRGLAPQLPLTAAMVLKGAFQTLDVPKKIETIELRYLQVAMTGGEGYEREINLKKKPDMTMVKLVESHFEELKTFLGSLMSGKEHYVSHRIPKKTQYQGNYDHLARLLEWSRGGDDEGGGEI